MSTSRRTFVKRSTILAGLTLSGCNLGQNSNSGGGQQWRNATNWDHAWDAADAVSYEDDGNSYGLEPATRVDSVPDYNGGHDLQRDDGRLMGTFNFPAAPGPLLQNTNPMFGGRPSWYSDTILPHDKNPITYFWAIHSGLTTPGSASENALTWQQPWWGAVLARAVGPFVGHNRAYIDGNPGMATIGISEAGTVRMRAWPDGNTFGPQIDSGVPFSEDTVLVQWYANGASSWLELNYRSAAEHIVSKRTDGAVAVSMMEQLHSGLSHTNYTSCIGIKQGVPTIAETDGVRNWAAPYIPTAVTLG